MKLLFIGDLQFGRNKDKTCNINIPDNILKIFNSVDVLFFNLETVLIDKNFDSDKYKLKNKDINIYSYGEPNVKYLKENINKPMFVSTINNHTFDYNVEGYYNTLQILDKYNYIFTVEKSYYIDDKFIFLNATDHWTILDKNINNYPENTKLWDKNCLLINSYEKEIYTYKLISHLNKIKGNRKIIFSIHWGKNFQSKHNNEITYLQPKYETFFKQLCNMGADVVFGHGSHHIVRKPCEIYNNKLIIYGLGDFTGDFTYKPEFNTDKNMMIIFNTDNSSMEKILLSGHYKSYQNDNDQKCKTSYVIDYLSKEKKYTGGGNTFATEIENKQLEPYLKKYNIKLDKINKELIYKNKRISYLNYFNDNYQTPEYCRDKSVTHEIFKKNDLPYPKSIDFDKLNNTFINQLQFPVIIKPKNGAGGHGIITDIGNKDELIIQLNKLNNTNYVIQEQQEGEIYRILILKNKIIYIKTFYKPSIIGNGNDSVEMLINKLNRSLSDNNNGVYVKELSYNYIKKQGYDKNSILENNKKIYITNVVNTFNGADKNQYISINNVHPVNIDLFLKAHKVFGLNFSGIDFISKSLEVPYNVNNSNFLEINWKPAFLGCVTAYQDTFLKTLIL